MNAAAHDVDGSQLVFSYGTLRLPEVQASLFGGPVPTTPDAVVSHRLVPVKIIEAAVIALSGSDVHTGLVASSGVGRSADRVEGSVLALTGAQLAAADAYESAYVRSSVPLASGRSAWAYLPAATAHAVDAGAGDGLDDGLDGVRRTVSMVVSGLGSVGSALLRLVQERADELRARHSLDLVVVAVVDSRGAALSPGGLRLEEVLALKARGVSVGEMDGVGSVGAGVGDVLSSLDALGCSAQVLVEAGPSDLLDGGAGLAAVLAARGRGMGVVLANKAPLVLAWDQVAGATGQHDGGEAGPPVRYSACVGAALPTVDLARAVAVSATLTRVEVVLNSTCQRVLGEVEHGSTVDEAIAGAQAAGLAEADPSMDVDGTDTAVKLVILAAALGHRVPLSAVEVTGIRAVTPQQVSEAKRKGSVLVLLGTAAPAAGALGGSSGEWRLVVAPVALEREHPLARMDRHETGVVVYTDVAGRIAASGYHRDVTATAAAVLRDVVVVAGELATRSGTSR